MLLRMHFVFYLLSYLQNLKLFISLMKVHPSSLSIDGTLGNFRLCDMSLGTDQCWDWLCDIRNSGVDSLIKVCFLFREREPTF
jgi:hypothetical protein